MAGLPTGWDWIRYDPNFTTTELLAFEAEVNAAYGVLRTTFPLRYLHLELPNSSPSPGATILLSKVRNRTYTRPLNTPSLLVFRRKTAATVDMCAFFFLRYAKCKPPSLPVYTLSIGVNLNVNPAIAADVATAGQDVFRDVTAVCQYVQNIQGLPTNAIELVNERDLPDDFDKDNTVGSKIVQAAFAVATDPDPSVATLVYFQRDLITDVPWPPVLRRYLVKQLP